MKTILVAIILAVGLSACTSPDEGAAPAPAPEPLAAPAAAAKAERRDTTKLVEASKHAFDAADKACRGCPNPIACQEALTAAVRLTAAALQSATQTEHELDQGETEATELARQFDGLAELSNECL